MNPQVSVIMPAYNAQTYISKSIESLLAQNFADWELIVINDGSTDNTQTILETFTDARITVIIQPNRGEAAARNVGLDYARGEFVGFLDSDDLYLPNALDDHVNFLLTHPEFDVDFSDGFFADAYGNYLMRLSEQRSGIYTGNILEALILDPTVVSFPVCTFVRRKIILQSGIRFDTNLVIGPDWDFWIQMARHAKFGYLDSLTCVYRVHETSITRISGYQKRLHDLAQGRLKILHSDWFNDLSLATRREFLRHLLVVLLKDETLQQEHILQSVPVQNLPNVERAYLLRMVASSYFSTLSRVDFATSCLEKALALWPKDRKSYFLLKARHLNPYLVYLVLRIWSCVLLIKDSMWHIGHRSPKPSPIMLSSSG